MRKGSRAGMGADRAARKRTRLIGGYPRRRKDDHGIGLFPCTGAGIWPRPVYAGRTAVRYYGLFCLPEGDWQAGLSAGRGALQSVSGGRAEPRDLAYTVCASGGHGGRPGHGRRRQPSDPAAVHRLCHAEPNRRCRYAAAAGFADGPVHRTAVHRISRTGG